jgi:para-nitrobenzyl esterase
MATATVSGGILAGGSAGGTSYFLGVPYAAAPVGPLRFLPPQPAPAWDGVRSAVREPPECVQPAPSGLGGILGSTPELAVSDEGLWICEPGQAAGSHSIGGHPLSCSEDSLYLNIFVPDDALRKKGELKPVMFWIHGGAFETGGGSSPMYDGIGLARSTGNLVVTVQYRLGCLGFLYKPGLHANLGLQDQIAALEWVHQVHTPQTRL